LIPYRPVRPIGLKIKKQILQAIFKYYVKIKFVQNIDIDVNEVKGQVL